MPSNIADGRGRGGRRKTTRDAAKVGKDERERVAEALAMFADLHAAYVALSAALETATAAAVAATGTPSRRALADHAEEIGAFRDILIARLVPLTEKLPADFRESVGDEWNKVWGVNRLAACTEWFREHKRLGAPKAAKIDSAQLDRLAAIIRCDVPSTMTWSAPTQVGSALRHRVERAYDLYGKQGPAAAAAGFLAGSFGRDAKTMSRARNDAKGKMRKVRIPRPL